mmetsp:Transcript_6414/g.17654  ORF Transcript_6414/g.17654 Transcript_6414/m.17654 type:complete len:280 (+) Transcript_6414:144-983(+)
MSRPERSEDMVRSRPWHTAAKPETRPAGSGRCSSRGASSERPPIFGKDTAMAFSEAALESGELLNDGELRKLRASAACAWSSLPWDPTRRHCGGASRKSLWRPSDAVDNRLPMSCGPSLRCSSRGPNCDGRWAPASFGCRLWPGAHASGRLSGTLRPSCVVGPRAESAWPALPMVGSETSSSVAPPLRGTRWAARSPRADWLPAVATGRNGPRMPFIVVLGAACDRNAWPPAPRAGNALGCAPWPAPVAAFGARAPPSLSDGSNGANKSRKSRTLKSVR